MQTTKGPQTFSHDGKQIDITVTMGSASHTARLQFKSAASQTARAIGTTVATMGYRGTSLTGATWVIVRWDTQTDLAVPLKKGTDIAAPNSSSRSEKAMAYNVQSQRALLQEALDKAKSDPLTSAVAMKFGTLDF